LRIPPVSGVLHSVKSGESISSIAKKYDIWESVIKNQNNIKDWDIIKIGQTLIIPWAKQIVVAPVISSAGSSSSSSSSSSSNNSWWWYNFANSANSSMTTDRWSYKLVRRQPAHSFAWGNCTWYVSQYKNVTWWWNANQWMSNARAKWISTWSNPSVWAIVQFSGTWYNPRSGHVWIVMEVYDSYIIVSDMNYRRINEVTYRRVPTNDRSIDGYIYID
jgi:surface antigen